MLGTRGAGHSPGNTHSVACPQSHGGFLVAFVFCPALPHFVDGELGPEPVTEARTQGPAPHPEHLLL